MPRCAQSDRAADRFGVAFNLTRIDKDRHGSPAVLQKFAFFLYVRLCALNKKKKEERKGKKRNRDFIGLEHQHFQFKAE